MPTPQETMNTRLIMEPCDPFTGTHLTSISQGQETKRVSEWGNDNNN